MTQKIVIIGGVAGGATAATRLRRLNETDKIVLFEKGEYISFANCGLPYHVGGVIKERENLLLQTVDGMNQQYGLDVRNFSEVLEINPQSKSVTVLNHQTGERYVESYDKLIISTGAKAIVPSIDGLAEAENVFSLRNIPDMDQIKAFIAENQIRTATVIGGGFIGLEMMENLVELGIQVQLIEMAPQVMPTIDIEMAQMIHSQINIHGVNLILNDGLKEFRHKGKELLLTSGKTLQSDMTILSIGVLPENTLAKSAGLELGFKGGIKVNQQMLTSEPDIYAIGDAIELVDLVSGQPTHIPLAWPANRQGRLVADIINGADAAYLGTQGTAAAKVFELTVASTGNSERLLKHAGIEYETIHIHPNSHAGYYPGASPIALKLLFGKDGKILGAQAIGTEGVEKRIDVIATAMRFGASADQLASIELAYAPPYSSAKDPVNMLGYTADNILSGKVATFQWSQVDDLVSKNAFFLDVREDFELATGTIESSHQIPLNQLRHRIEELPKDQTIYVFCQVGHRGYNAARILSQAGFDVKNLDGGYKTYKMTKYQLKPIVFEESNQNQTTYTSSKPEETSEIIRLDACGLQCPGPILKVKENIDKMSIGQKMEVEASDFGFSADIEAWCQNTGNTLLSNRIENGKVIASIAKGKVENSGIETTNLPSLGQEGVLQETKDGATMVVFSGDLDKAIASMIIASGAAAYGKKVTIFFTFWGLSILKKQKVKKTGLAKLFDMMLPSRADALPLSQMNMGGMGSAMIKHIMKQKNVDSLPDMIEKAHQLGVKFVACTMSMDLMGIEKEELFDFVEYGGVATFIGDSEKANMQLFI
ncbi:pyridine nucleotide-disulfide oxidoreductase [Streptococcus agalactiae]|uniref:FAD-dependent oxidoreductase n=2 Tax=Streptococcus agalactiae TaxID=1311 RepID=UPI0002BB72DD|nr:FAD-dependent oxidoreductase [Streptococcus agalactiae]AOQ20017.1 pyridine nucleotide-disulfide oxidoreductase [Streptococcus agalactiae]EPU07357.1 CoA-disulfide reductase [Streptococcus agalactiae STIR-CD-21]EPU08662.1 CoA-disulfide reductase [Streptococcus agalactiae STIR-CD-22]MCC9700119.1 FAD-dependent oxidoreductase [Streptococcus agalactiae]MCD0027907.1 FAD-dependent oxidoreductase [Streptococcus agalactiae]